MKKLQLLLIGILFTTLAFAQTNTFPATGSVGVGTTTPATPLHIKGKVLVETNDDDILTFNNTDNSWQFMQFKRLNSRYAWMGLNDLNDFCIIRDNPGNIILYSNAGGNVGIGTTTPLFKLDVGGTTRVDVTNVPAFTTKSTLGVVIQQGNIGNDFYNGNNYLSIMGHNIEYNGANWIRRNQYGNTFATVLNSQYYDVQFAQANGNQPANTIVNPSTYFRITENGNVGIGTTTPQSKLAVNGGIFSKHIKVTQTGWPDYVFASNYKLPSLKEVATFIQEHQHLPGVTSAKEVEEKGLDLGENQAALLKKIEELTLYVIEADKRTQALEERISQLEKSKR